MAEAHRVAARQWIEQHRAMFDAFMDAFCIVDADNRLIEFNDAFVDFSGLTHRKLLKIGDLCQVLRFKECPDGCPSRQMLASGQPLRLDEVRTEVPASPGTSLNLIIAGIPILVGGETVGAFLHIRNVSAEAQLQEKYVKTRSQSIIDGLTQLYNRTYVEKRLLLMTKTFQREGLPFTLVMCDLDFFKSINDTHGHPAGDQVLRIFSATLRQHCRDTDVVGRFGGEEFIALLPKCTPDGAKIFMQRFRQRLAVTSFPWQSTRLKVTTSLGTATISKPICETHGGDAKRIAEQLVAEADKALYFAKHQGRDQGWAFEDLPTR